MKRIFSLLMTIAIVVSLCGCQIVLYAPQSDTEVSSHSHSQNENKSSLKNNPHINETVLLDDKNIIVTAEKLEYKSDAIDFVLQIENNSDEILDADIKNVTVNDYMMQEPLGGTINPGKKADIHIWFDPNVLSICDINEIADIELEIIFRYSEDREEYFKTPRLRLETSAFNDHDYSFNDSGTVVYEKDDLKIVSKDLISKGFYQYGPSALFYVENNSNDVYHIMFDDIAVNDTMVYPFATVCTVLPGKHAIMGLSFVPDHLKEIGIDTIEEVENIQFCFTILKNELYFSTSDENNTDLITIHISDVIK